MWEFILLKNPLQRKSGRSTAQGMVEFALVMPILFLLIYGLLEAGRLIFIYSSVVTAAREGVRYASTTGIVNGNPQFKDCAGIRAAAQKVDFLNAITNIEIQYYQPADTNPSYTILGTGACPVAAAIPNVPPLDHVKVIVTGHFESLVGIVPLKPVTFSSIGQRTLLGKVLVDTLATLPPGASTLPPVISKVFSPEPILADGLSTLTFTISNPNSSKSLSGIGFSDIYPTPPDAPDYMTAVTVPSTNCNGTLTYTSGSVTLAGASLAAKGYCTISVVVTVHTDGSYVNTSSRVTSTEAGDGNTASYTMRASSVVCNSTTVTHGPLNITGGTLNMNITNSTGLPLTISSIYVSWNSTQGHNEKHNTNLNLTQIKLGTNPVQLISPADSGPDYTYYPTAWTLPTNGSTVKFTFHQSYDITNATELVAITFSTFGCTDYTLSSAMIAPAQISKAFTPASIPAGSMGTLTFTITNPNSDEPLQGVAFTDIFPTNPGAMTAVAAPATTCGGALSYTTDSVTLSGGSVAPADTCTVTILVTAPSIGNYDNTSQPVTTTNAGAGNSATATLRVTAPVPYTLTVTKSGNGTGTVTSDPPGISCNPTCSHPFNSGTVVTLTAASITGSFTGWGGACSGSGTCSVTMNAAKTVIANFNVVYPLSITIGGTGSGTVSSSPPGINCPSTCSFSYNSGTTVALTASIPPLGTVFSGWGGACSGTGACSINMSAAQIVTATFTMTPTYTLSVATNGGTGAGMVKANTGIIDCGSTCSDTFNAGTVVILTATPIQGSSTFTSWSGSCTGTGTTCTVSMSTDKSVVANFSKIVLPAPILSYKKTGNSGKVTLNWTSVTGASNYRLYKSIDGGTTYTSVQFDNSLSFDDNIGNGQTFLYYVTAATSGGAEGIPSSIVTVKG